MQMLPKFIIYNLFYFILMYGTKILISILQTMTGEWQPPEGSEVAQPPRDNPITGHVIQRLFNMVSPPTVSNSYSLLNTINQLLFTIEFISQFTGDNMICGDLCSCSSLNSFYTTIVIIAIYGNHE